MVVRFYEGTISVHNGFILQPEQIDVPYGSLPTLHFTTDIRFWTSTSVLYPQWPISVTDEGGCDALRATGEPHVSSCTMGSQRPAL
ncbi:MAG: hypothetical protein HFG16_08980 [Erysipelotrichaceae bacterium]|jgi:hypothetical protein|nr:hypothetical protein [Erysipelotrichaceae bacterium]